ncbi:MAG: hypothetical protein ACI4C1_09740 [Lachnospiraceae bacterium]
MITWTDEIPKTGYLLIYFKDGVEFQRYENEQQGQTMLAQWSHRTILEAHFFDETHEYRYVTSRRKGEITALITEQKADANANTNVNVNAEWMFIGKKAVPMKQFVETVRVLPQFCSVMRSIRMINYLEYDENDMLYVSDYRLAPGQEDSDE